MYGFEFVTARDAAEASKLLERNDGVVRIIAGGTDLLGEIKERTIHPEKLVSLQNNEDIRRIRIYDEGVLIGAMSTLADIAANPDIRRMYPAFAEACISVATPQIRNIGTIGGNLCQRPRCWYYRNYHFDCLKKGGDACFALDGANKFHAIFDAEICPAVHPSDTAVALIAVDARVLLISSSGARMMPIEEFFVGPDVGVTTENVLRADEMLAEVIIPSPVRNSRSVFVKAKERQAMDFALASVALSADLDGEVVTGARIVLGGVAPTPRRALGAEELLAGTRLVDVNADDIGRIAVEAAKPLADNRFKVRLTSGLVSRAVRMLLGESVPEASSR